MIGTALVFVVIYILQYLIFAVTSIYISPHISVPIFIISAIVILLIFISSIIFMFYKLKKKEIANAVKF